MAKGGSGGGGGKRGGGGRGAGGGGTVNQPEPVQSTAGMKFDYGDEVNVDNPPVKEGGVEIGTPAEQLPKKYQDVIHAYTGGQVSGGERFAGINAEKMNKALYDPVHAGTLSEDVLKRTKAYEKELNIALEHGAKYQGESYRVVSNYQAGKRAGTQGLAERFETGKVAKFDEFLSTAHGVDSTFTYRGASTSQMRFRIHGKTGVKIEDISKYGMAEKEVLFGSGKKFMVNSKKWNTVRGNWDIEITEL